MRTCGSFVITLLLLSACNRGAERAPSGNGGGTAAPPATAAEAAPQPKAAAPDPRWDLQSSGEGVALALPARAGGTAIRLFCTAGRNRLVVNVPGFRPIGSEDRLSFGSGGDATALVADTGGDRLRGGVTGSGAVPGTLAALLAGPVSASYGAQTSGPHPPIPQDLVRSFAGACQERAAADPAPAAPAKGSAAAAAACLMQGSQRLRVAPLRAVGTEPFWGARIEGRCVTYSHPEDQAGTRIWTRYAPAAGGGGTWSGALGGRAFELRIRTSPGCSDGMSDRVYPLAAELLVGGQRRTGCAAPL